MRTPLDFLRRDGVTIDATRPHRWQVEEDDCPGTRHATHGDVRAEVSSRRGLKGLFGSLGARSASGAGLMLSFGVAFMPAAPAIHMDSPGWSIVASPSPAIRDGAFYSVSCGASGMCMAAGLLGANVEVLRPTSKGSSWAKLPVPVPAGSAGSFGLEAVSCTSATACTVLGGYTSNGSAVMVAERWNGSTWSMQTIPSPSGSTASSLLAISCGSATTCMAVGNYSTATSPYLLLTASWKGSKWKVVPAASVGNALTTLSGVSCSSANACVAVGQSGQDVERWNGRKWKAQSLPQPAGGIRELNAVSCKSATWCTAVGEFNDGGPPAIVAWNGRHWKMQSAPEPPDGGYGVYSRAVSCASATSCSLVGDYGYCSTAGHNLTGPTQELTFAEHWNGSAWSLKTTGNPLGDSPNNELLGVSCAAVTACTAVGAIGGNLETLAEVWNGHKWAVQRIPTPTVRPGSGDGASGFLNGVSCPSTSMRMAVGQQNVAHYGQPTGPSDLSELRKGGKWKILTTPNGSTNQDDLLSVSCSSAKFCVADGTAGTSALLESWDGSSWTIETVPLPSTNYGSQLFGVSCSSSSACTATGAYTNSGGVSVPLVARWNGAKWSRQGAPSPSGSAGSAFYGVSCWATRSCIAVGTSGQPLSELWNGKKWVPQPIPLTSDGTLSFPYAVSCRSLTFCEATASGIPSTFAGALGWKRSKWSVQSVPSPDLDSYSGLTGVSCGSDGVCFAVGGGYIGSTPPSLPTLIERYIP